MPDRPVDDQNRKKLLSADDIRRAIARLAHEVVERNQGVEFLHAAILYCQLVFSGFGHYVVMESK